MEVPMEVPHRELYSVETSTSTAWVTLFYAMGYNLIALFLVALSWGVGHHWPFWRRMLIPRNAVGERGAFVKPMTLLGAIKKVVGATEEEMVRVCGTDAAVYVRFFTLTLQMYIILNVTALPILLVFYQQGANPNGVSGIEHLSLSNVENQSTVMWVSAAVLCFMSLVIYYLIWRHTIYVVHLRRQFFRSKARALDPHNYATVVTCIPPPPLVGASLEEESVDGECPTATANGAAENGEEEGEKPGTKGGASKRGPRPWRPGQSIGSSWRHFAPVLPEPKDSVPKALTPRDFLASIKDLFMGLYLVLPGVGGTGGGDKTEWEPIGKSRYVFSESAVELVETKDMSLTAQRAPPLSARNCEGEAAGDEKLDASTTRAVTFKLADESSLGVGQTGSLTFDGSAKPSQSWNDGSFSVAPEVTPADIQPYALPGEPRCPPHITDFFFTLFKQDLLHVQPVYNEGAMAKAHGRWRHAIRMLNESRQRWEQNLKKAAAGEEAKVEGRAEGGDSSILNEGDVEESQGGGAGTRKSQEKAPLSWRKGKEGKKGKAKDEVLDPWPRHKIGKKWLFFGGEEVESIPYWIEQVKQSAVELKEAQVEALRNPRKTAVVAIFKDRRAAALCKEAMDRSSDGHWWALPAAPPQEMWWDNLRFSAYANASRTFWATLMTVVMVIFFYIPVTLIASLASGKALGTTIGAQKEEVQNTWLPPSLQSIVPSLALHSVLWIFSPVFMLIARWEGRISLPDAMVVSSSRFYYVVVINVLIAYSLTSSLLTELQNVIAGEVTIHGLFATTLPANAAFYIQYTLNSSLMCGMELGRLPIHICCYMVKYLLIGKSYCDRERHWDQGPMAYHVFVGYANLIMTFGVVYCIISPLILPFSLLYFIIAHFTWKHELMFVYRDPADKGGIYWPRLVHHLLNALFIAQITTAGIFSAKLAFSQAGVAAATFLATVLFRIWFTARFAPIFRAEPLDIVAHQQAPVEGNPLLEDPARLAHSYYPSWMRPPVMPDLDPMAPSDPNIWYQMHPTRDLYVLKNYYPTPTVQYKQGDVVPEPEEEAEKAFWEVTEVIPPKKVTKRKWMKGRKGDAASETMA